LLATLCSNLAPLLRAFRNQACDSLKTEGRGTSLGKGKRRQSQVFVVSEFVFSLVLPILGALLVESFLKLQHVDPGFDTSHLLTFHLIVPRMTYGEFVDGPNNTRRERLYEQLEQSLNAVPGAESVAFTSSLPLAHEFNPWPVVVEGREPAPPRPGSEGSVAAGSQGDTAIQVVNPRYFDTLRLRLVNGRFLDERDNPNALMTAMVNEAFVRAFFPNENPIGKRVTVWFAKPTIVGIVADFKLNAIDRKPLPEIFWSIRQVPSRNVWVLARASSNPLLLSAALRQKVHDFDPDLAMQDVHPMSEVIPDSLWLHRVSAILIGVVAALAIALAAAGIYSVMSYSVSQRTKEVGIRVALGATRRDVLGLVIGETCRLAMVGAVGGCMAAYLAGRLATSQVYLSPGLATSQIQTASLNPAAFILSSLFLFGELHAPYFMEWSLGLEHQFGSTASIHAQYVGTRAVNQPYLTQANGYQTVCEGCFAPFPYAQPTDP
jgi:putative ABC transport system permease protein